MNDFLWLLFIALNLATFAVYGIDKWKARRKLWRIPETTLLTLALVGGSIGALMGMRVFRHKTLHKKFRYGIPFIIFLQACALLWFQWCRG